jgi:large subunit ribosomal protein L49
MALPRPSTLHRFLGIVKSSTAAAPSPSAATTPSQTKPYRVLRTPSNNLPIYLLRKRGGNLHQTKLRKIEGNINVLRKELREALGMDEKEVVINQLTKAIIIKVRICGLKLRKWARELIVGQGHKKPEVTKFLEERQF